MALVGMISQIVIKFKAVLLLICLICVLMEIVVKINLIVLDKSLSNLLLVLLILNFVKMVFVGSLASITTGNIIIIYKNIILFRFNRIKI